MKKRALLFLLALALTGCAAAAPEIGTTAPAVTQTAPSPTVTVAPEIIAEEAAAMAQAPEPPEPVLLECEAPGILEERTEFAVVDYSNTADGYVMACYLQPSEKRLKLRVQGPTTTYTYNLTPESWTVFPLSDGSGAYKVTLYRNTSGTKYTTLMSLDFAAELADEFAPFLRPNQYVDYANAPNTLEMGSQLCTGIEDPLQKVAAVYDYVVSEFSYDQQRAETVQSGYLPVLDSVLEEKKGICFDYAALMTAMLRSQNVPCKLVVGYAGSVYHAWISVWTEENGWVDGAIFFDGKVWKRMDPTFASSGGRSEEIMTFIESGTYTAKYLY